MIAAKLGIGVKIAERVPITILVSADCADNQFFKRCFLLIDECKTIILVLKRFLKRENNWGVKLISGTKTKTC